MAGSYFDFSTTPITSDITLKAKWCGCQGGEPVFPFSGDYFRVTLTDGTKWLAPDNRTNAYNFVNSSGTSGNNAGVLVSEDGSTTRTVKTVEVTEIEFGKGWEECTIQYICCYSSDNRWGNLVKISGYPDGLGAALSSTAYNSNCHIGYDLAAQATARPVEVNLRLPATYAAAAYGNTHGLPGGGPAYSKRYVYGKIYFDYSPAQVNLSSGGWGTQFECNAENYAGCANGDCVPSDYATWWKGWGFGGPYAGEWLNQYQPIATCSQPSKCILRNTYVF